MATQAEKKNGPRTRPKRASRLRRKGTEEDETAKHKPAVLCAKNKERKVIPTKAVDEWPEGNDLRPSKISLTSLCFVSDDLVEKMTFIRTQCRYAPTGPTDIEQESLGEVDLEQTHA
jgi:hypothetical protein